MRAARNAERQASDGGKEPEVGGSDENSRRIMSSESW
jgi:hypothetical protein